MYQNIDMNYGMENMKERNNEPPILFRDDPRLTTRFRPEEPYNPNRIENMNDVIDVWTMIQDGVDEGNLMTRTLSEVKHLRDNFILTRQIGTKEIMGCIGLDVYTPRLAEIRSLYVKPEYRSFGIGRVLVEQAIQKARSNNIKEIIAITDKVAMFKKSGFHEVLNDQKALFMKL